MADKELPERMGIAETRIEDLIDRVEELETARKNYQERRERTLISGMWLCIKLAALTTFLTITTPKMREGVARVYGYFFP